MLNLNLLVSINVNQIVTYVILSIVVVATLVFLSFFFVAKTRTSAYKKVKVFIDELNKYIYYTNIEDLKHNQQIEIEYYDEEISRFILNDSEIPERRINSTILLIDNFIDSKKNNFVIDKYRGSLLLKDKLSFVSIDGQIYEIDYKDIFYISGTWNYRNDGLLMEIILYDNETNYLKNIKFQIVTYQDIALFLNKIKHFKRK